jgi:hypothetical protein
MSGELVGSVSGGHADPGDAGRSREHCKLSDVQKAKEDSALAIVDYVFDRFDEDLGLRDNDCVAI